MNFVLNLRSHGTAGAVVPGRITHGDLAELQRATSVTFLVHGFNVNRRDGRNSLLGFAQLLPGQASNAVVAVLWPGDSHAGPIGYPFERNDAEDSAAELAKFILGNLPVRPRLNFVAHSLGSRVTMRTTAILAANGYPVDQVCLMAAAIDDDSLASSDVYRAAAKSITRIAVLHSRKDKVLGLIYPLGDGLQAFVYGDELCGSALGYRGPRSRRRPIEAIPANVLSTKIDPGRGARHSDYLPDGPGTANPKQRAAADYADAVLRGEALPAYP